LEDKRLNLSKIIQETKEGVVFTVYVKPESMRERLRLEYGELVFYTNEPAEKGRANASLVRFISRILNVPSSHVDIVLGVRSKVKRVLVKGLSKDNVIDILCNIV